MWALLEFLIPEHIQQRIPAPYGRKQLGMLGDRCAHEQAAIGASADGEVFGRGVLLVDQVASGREPVIEDVLLFGEHPLLMPALAILSSTAHVGNGEPSTLLQPP